MNVLAIGNIPRTVFLEKPGYTFLSSTLTLFSFAALFGAALFPNLITSSLSPEYSLTIYNGASSEKPLKIMRIIAFCGMPFVLSYTYDYIHNMKFIVLKFYFKAPNRL